VYACPKCGSRRVHRSRARSRIEFVHKFFSLNRLHRCHACGWRGRGEETEPEPEPVAVLSVPAAPPDFTALDASTSISDLAAQTASDGASSAAPRAPQGRLPRQS
jgi:hypothetical protein